MAREIRKDDASKFIKKAEEFYQSAMENYQKGRLNASAFDSSQSIILANDAFTIYALGRRASKDHREAIQMHITASGGKESKRDILAEALEKRSEFGYTDRECKDSEANLLLVRTKRFIEWAKGKINYEEPTKGKGQAILLNHAILVGFTIFLVYVVFTTFAEIKKDYQELVGGNEIKELCFVMRGAIDKVYSPSEFNVSNNVSLGRIDVRLPERITDLKYRTKIFNKNHLI